MKNRLQLLTVVALLMAASFGLRNLITPAHSTMAAAVVSAVPGTGTGGPVPPPTLLSSTIAVPDAATGTGGPVPPPTLLLTTGSGPDVCTGTGGPVPPTCLAPRTH